MIWTHNVNFNTLNDVGCNIYYMNESNHHNIHKKLYRLKSPVPVKYELVADSLRSFHFFDAINVRRRAPRFSVTNRLF